MLLVTHTTPGACSPSPKPLTLTPAPTYPLRGVGPRALRRARRGQERRLGAGESHHFLAKIFIVVGGPPGGFLLDIAPWSKKASQPLLVFIKPLFDRPTTDKGD